MYKKFCFGAILSMALIAYHSPVNASEEAFDLFGAVAQFIDELPSEEKNSDDIDWNSPPSEQPSPGVGKKRDQQESAKVNDSAVVPEDYESAPKTERARAFLQAFQDGHEIAAWYLCVEVSKRHTDLDIIKWCRKAAEKDFTTPSFALGTLYLQRSVELDIPNASDLAMAEKVSRQAIQNCQYDLSSDSKLIDEINLFRAALPFQDPDGKFSVEKFLEKERGACIESHVMMYHVLTISSLISNIDEVEARSIYDEAFNHLTIAADMGNAESMHLISQSFLSDAGDGFNLQKAIEWETKALSSGLSIERLPIRDLVDVPIELFRQPVLLRAGIDDVGANLGYISYCLAFNSFLEDQGPRRVQARRSPLSDNITIMTEVNRKDLWIRLKQYDGYLLISKIGIGGITGSSFGDAVQILGAIMHEC
ncbi:hypothetical protein SAMN05216196_1153 [Lutimaribacter pacificus]|uniref:Sel1 repeat-containing protein n=1 Tax=Lutimaribacter pacificus TaxID=391948 RepID=A0A1H0NYY2_9RHOB|nr:hypothetical protein [Lutimaribacter pacificus]SDO98002.1 hypothetical protein SAMN05216196_1153 [Lutimaribacter pacificus]SHK97201.1 hypothetical protein SAMN05444142_1152 [Lutimaribacter pacificus]